MNPKLNVLILYACSESPFRKTFKSFLESFQKHSEHNVVYVNYPFFFPKKMLCLSTWDLVIYTHSITAPWNRERYKRKIEELKDLNIKAQKKIAFFQDEYFNTDLINEFINELSIDFIFSVAPETEWPRIYPNVPKSKIFQYLTGYIDEDDIDYADKLLKSTTKDIGISYRTAYPGSQMTALGPIGWLKYEIADFGHKLAVNGSDIQVGSNFLTGDDWYKLLARSEFTLGVPSGSNILDTNGNIGRLAKTAEVTSRRDLEIFFKQNKIDTSFQLEVISPRIFEAGLFNCCQILVEGNYSNLIEKYVHYIPVSKDFSNYNEVKRMIEDPTFVKKIVSSFRKDIVENPRYTYRTFISEFYRKFSDLKKDSKSLNASLQPSLQVSEIGLKIYSSNALRRARKTISQILTKI